MESAIKENVGNSYFKLLNQKTLEDNSEICTNNKWKNNNIREQILLEVRQSHKVILSLKLILDVIHCLKPLVFIRDLSNNNYPCGDTHFILEYKNESNLLKGINICLGTYGPQVMAGSVVQRI